VVVGVVGVGVVLVVLAGGLGWIVVLERLGVLEGREEVKEGEMMGLRRAVEAVGVLAGLEGKGEGGGGGEEEKRVREMWDEVDWEGRIAALEVKVKPDFVEPEIDRDGAEVNMPADLSVLTDERPSGWRDGVEMTAEMSLRIFLKHFRKDNELFGEEISKAMHKMFNKRRYSEDNGKPEAKSG
jgi:hypothetical protein